MNKHIKIIKYIDKIIGSHLVRLLPKRKSRSKPFIGRILIIRPGGIGDAALLTPILSMVKVKYPSIRLDILCESRNSGIFYALSFVNTIFLYEKPLHLLEIIKTPYDLVIDTEQSHFLSAIVCRILARKYAMGFEAYGRGRMFDYAESYSHDTYEADMFLKLFRHFFDLPLNVTWTFDYFKRPNMNQLETVESLLALGKDLVCLFPGATINERKWPIDRWAEVSDFISASGCLPLLLGGDMEFNLCRNIQNRCREKVVNICGKLSLLQTAWLFERSRLLVSTDSGILHLGVICNLLTVSLFGSGIKEKWGPKGEGHKVVYKNLPCSPCTLYGKTSPCQNFNKCMLDIDSMAVIYMIKRLLV